MKKNDIPPHARNHKRQFAEESKRRKRARRCRRNRRIIKFIIAVAAFCVLEWFGEYNVQTVEAIRAGIGAAGVGAFSLLLKSAKFLLSYLRKSEREQIKKAQTLGELVINLIRCVRKVWRGGTVVRFLIASGALCFLACVAANAHTCSRITAAAYAFWHFEEVRQQEEISSRAEENNQKGAFHNVSNLY